MKDESNLIHHLIFVKIIVRNEPFLDETVRFRSVY